MCFKLPGGGGGKKLLLISSDGDDRMAAKIKLQKDPNGFQESPPAGILGHYYESSDFFEYPKKPLLKTSHPKYIHKMV